MPFCSIRQSRPLDEQIRHYARVDEMTPWWRDELGARLESLADDIEAEYSQVCTVVRTSGQRQHDIRNVWVTPTNPAATAVGWDDMGSQLQAYAGGGHGGRWELDRSPDDVDFIEEVVHAAIEGRVAEVLGPSRSRVEVTLRSGEVVAETGGVAPGGCLPLPGWVKFGRRLQYEPYRP